MRPIAVIGSLSHDTLPGLEPRAGGCPYYAARALRLLERPSRVVTKCTEEHRRILLGSLLALGVPVSWRPAERSMGFEYFPDGDTRAMSITSVGDPWTLEEIRGWVAEAIKPCEWVHVAPLMREEFPVEAIAELAREHVLSFDGQGLAREPRLGPLALDSAFDRELLRHISVIKLSEEEAAAIVGEPTTKALTELGVAEVVVTLGSRGSLVFSDGELTPVPARPVVANVDTTGAGDEYAAIYLAARSRGRSPVLAARRASAFVGAILSRRLPVA